MRSISEIELELIRPYAYQYSVVRYGHFFSKLYLKVDDEIAQETDQVGCATCGKDIEQEFNSLCQFPVETVASVITNIAQQICSIVQQCYQVAK